ncbi:MAG TPA: SPFH domain-containing protein [Myxococcales bacterium]|nr:SPFH domain-containing protein [Myxococcales bacterium]
MKRLLLLGAMALASFSGCTCHSTDSTEVGVLTRKVSLFGQAGVQDEIYAPGATYLFMPFVTDWHTYDVSLQNLAMVRDAKKGDRSSEDDLRFKTIDGNEIRVDVTVVWQIDPKKAPHVLTSVGEDTGQVKEKLVRPACRSVVRDVLNELSSEDFYVSDKRFEKADKARDQLHKVLAPEGVLVQQVILGEHKFTTEYEQVIRDKKLAEQTAEKLRSQARAAAEEAKRKLETAKGQVQQQLAEADGYLAQVKLKADADFVQNQKRAEAIVFEKKAAAEAIRKNNEALAGSGGRTMVKLRLAEALAGKTLLFVPTGGGGAQLQTLNLNALLKTYGGPEAQDVEPAKLGEKSPE